MTGCRWIFLVLSLYVLVCTIYVYEYGFINIWRIKSSQRQNLVPVNSTQEGMYQYGTIKPGQKYAVVTTTISNSRSTVNYGFSVPLDVLAWKRIGYDTLVMLIGDPKQCENGSKLHYMVEELVAMDHVVVLVMPEVDPIHAATISQVSRLFAATLIQGALNTTEWLDTYLITADSDIWPIAYEFFDLPAGKDIFHGNIGTIKVKGTEVIHAPLSFVGMKIRTWIDVMSQSGTITLPETSRDVIKHIKSLYGPNCCDNVIHGGPGWSIDQSLISLRIHEWKVPHRNDRVFLYPRNFLIDRFDRIRWPHFKNTLDMLKGIVDTHILQHSYEPSTWKRLRPLLKLMLSDDSVLSWCDNYADSFNKKEVNCV